ncbi:two-component system response regulator TctD [Variovorax sp. TBS-050B]|jgi:two-component system, OmpR family, response regulator TctD|uniref:response regulator transcription factor n=1 Tax=Variovorax sp. TBS-050B TaxID=2940551 RepID=UPI002473B36D|nr:response regulator transcription factor [Variovorax sp. TBS-050B]MDH6594147.1 two-component system response regulator TctD [Variovorax sp. TBS-050B]
MKLLLIEDDPSMQVTLQRALARNRIDVRICGDGAQAVEQWRAIEPDVVALDLSLPNLDGLQVLAQARASGLRTPVLLLTARGTVGDRIMGLNAGADDYLPKPFDLDELEARLRALRRRNQNAAGGIDPVLHPQEVGDLRFDPESGAVYHRGAVLELTPRELSLLKALMMKPGHALTKERLFELVFPGETDVQYEAVEVVVYRLRKKLAGTGAALMTLRGLGYLLRAET